MAVGRAALDSAKGRPISPANLPTPENVKAYITNCIKRYQELHNLPADSLKVSDADWMPVARGSKTTGDAYHLHSCGLSDQNCKKVEDYQMQIMLLEHQNKRRLMMARGQMDATDAGPKQPATAPSHQEIKCRHFKWQDYQRQLMREEQHAKKEQPMSSHPGQGKSVGQSMPEPQDRLNEQAMKNLSLGEYQKQLMSLRRGSQRDRFKFDPVMAGCPPVLTDVSVPVKQGTSPGGMQQEGAGVPSIAPIPPGAQLAPTRASTDTSSMLTDANHFNNRAAIPQRRSSVQDYEMQLMLLEQQNKKRLMMARSEHEKTVADSAKQKIEMGSALGAPFSNQDKGERSGAALQDYQMQLMLLEQQRKKLLILERNNQQKPSASGPSHDQGHEQVTEKGSALGAQENGHDKSPLAGASPANAPLVVRQDAKGVQWITFEYCRDRIHMEYTIRCDINTVNCNGLSPEFRTENCVYPQAFVPAKEYKGSPLLYEAECNVIGWGLAHLNPCLRNKRGLLGRAVDSYRNSIRVVVHPYCEDDEEENDGDDAAMWSTDEFDEWSNCDDMESIEKDEI